MVIVHNKFPPNGLRYGDLRDWELQERDERRWPTDNHPVRGCLLQAVFAVLFFGIMWGLPYLKSLVTQVAVSPS